MATAWAGVLGSRNTAAAQNVPAAASGRDLAFPDRATTIATATRASGAVKRHTAIGSAVSTGG